MSEFVLEKKINHIAFIMDGNGRWAKKRMLPRTMGHREGCKRIIEVVRSCIKYQIFAVSLYAFSTENWNRPQNEIDCLFNYLEDFFNDYIDEFIREGVSIRVSGDPSRLPQRTQEIIKEGIEKTKDLNKHIFNICLNYGSRQEILRATKEMAIDFKNGVLKEEDFNDKTMQHYLYTHDMPEIDLLVRTSGEERLSNFLLYQMAYAEFIFTPTYWPDFKEKNFVECLKEFQNRDRRFGAIKE